MSQFIIFTNPFALFTRCHVGQPSLKDHIADKCVYNIDYAIGIGPYAVMIYI